MGTASHFVLNVLPVYAAGTFRYRVASVLPKSCSTYSDEETTQSTPTNQTEAYKKITLSQRQREEASGALKRVPGGTGRW